MRKPFLEKDELPEFVREKSGKEVCRTFVCELITPMMGGDSESWVLHPDQPVRGQSIKGQLRFWWRTMQSESDPKVLLQRENEIWGGKVLREDKETKEVKAERIQSLVKIAVLGQQIHKSSLAVLNEKGFAIEGDVIPVYVGFPVTPAIKKEKKDVTFIESLSFDFQVSCSADLWSEVEKTLKLWVLFGGVGARTRRGCGSLYCEELLEEFKNEKDVVVFLKKCSSRGETLAYPRLDGACLAVKAAGTDALSAWKGLIDAYAGFRQDRRPNKPIPGRSYWPEPDTIREITKQRSSRHKLEHKDLWFPRAAYGLPINTEFNLKGNGVGDPSKVELMPKDAKRWPSPVILKALRLPSGKALRMALLLNQAFPKDLKLKQGNSSFPVSLSAHPFVENPKVRKMKIRQDGDLREGETLYQALFRELGLEEVK